MKKTILLLALFMTTNLVINAQEIGIQLYSVRNQTKTDLEGTLKKLRAMGIRELEGIDFYGKSVTDYKKLLDKLDFKFVGFGVDYGDLSKDLTQVIYNAKTRFVYSFFSANFPSINFIKYCIVIIYII